jgi:hypothetical protein
MLFRLFPNHFAGVFVLAQAQENRLSQFIITGPHGKGNHPDAGNKPARKSSEEPAQKIAAYLLDGLNVKTAPQIAVAMPPIKSQSVLLVGVPLNVREMAELVEFDASMP